MRGKNSGLIGRADDAAEAILKSGVRDLPRQDIEHGPGKIEADDVPAQREELQRDVPGPASKVEIPHGRLHALLEPGVQEPEVTPEPGLFDAIVQVVMNLVVIVGRRRVEPQIVFNDLFARRRVGRCNSVPMRLVPRLRTPAGLVLPTPGEWAPGKTLHPPGLKRLDSWVC